MSPAEKKGNNKVGLEDIVRGLTSVAESDVEKKKVMTKVENPGGNVQVSPEAGDEAGRV